MNDVLSLLWSLVDAPDPILPGRIVGAWPDGIHGKLVASGILQPAEPSSTVLCPECFEHEEEVIAIEGPGGRTRLMIPCPEALRVEVPPALLQQWAISLASLVDQIAVGLQLTGKPLEMTAGRLWRLGRTRWAGVQRDVLFARGLTWDDAPSIGSAICRATRPIIFVASFLPEATVWPGRAPNVLPLTQFSTLEGGRLELDYEAIYSAIAEAESTTASQPATFTVEQLKQIVRNQVKAEELTQLTDDVFAEAYRREGSYRKAAAFLSQQSGQVITKDQVAFAVQRLGGLAAVVRDQDSESIVRKIASQRRDRSGRNVNTVKVRDL